MLRFGGTVTLNGLIVYFAYNLDKVLLGRVWGPVALGYYGTASQLINVPTANLNKAVGGVTFSALSRLQHDLIRFKNYFLKGYALVLSMTLPLTVFAAMFAGDIVLVVLGPKWTEAVPIFRHLARHARHFGSERVELVHHRVDGVLELEDLALDVHRDLLRKVALRHRRRHLGDVAAPGR